MKISDLVKFGEYEVLTNPDYEDKEITGCYIGDLLSWVMGRANSGDMWITVMSNINIVAVATLSDASCIVLAEDVDVESGIIAVSYTHLDVYKRQLYYSNRRRKRNGRR